jgi:hypothetical protein
MPPKSSKLLIAGVFLLALCTLANAQKAPKQLQNSPKQLQSAETRKTSPAMQVLNLSGQIAVIVVGQGAKAAWKVTKFTASDMAKPIVKGIFLKATPALSRFGMKITGKVIKKGFPVVQKLAVTYLKTRLSI